jgi:hypothetical protein
MRYHLQARRRVRSQSLNGDDVEMQALFEQGSRAPEDHVVVAARFLVRMTPSVSYIAPRF